MLSKFIELLNSGWSIQYASSKSGFSLYRVIKKRKEDKEFDEFINSKSQQRKSKYGS